MNEEQEKQVFDESLDIPEEAGELVTPAKQQKNREEMENPEQPHPDSAIPPVLGGKVRRHRKVRYFPPVGQLKNPDILFIAGCVMPEEASMMAETKYGNVILEEPGLLKGPLGHLMKNMVNGTKGLSFDSCAYATAIPWLLPKERCFAPETTETNRCAQRIRDMVREFSPKIVVVFEKWIFDILQIQAHKLKKSDARGAWFSGPGGVSLYLCDPAHQLLTRPWLLEQFSVDLRDIALHLTGIHRHPSVACNYIVIKTFDELEALVELWELGNYKRFSVDCEWAGTDHLRGNLRSFQLCWAPGQAAYLNFFDEKGEKFLGQDYQRAGEILGRWLNQPGVDYVGHHISADFPWMHHWLELDVWRRCHLDTEYAQQTLNEYIGQGLEQIALRYTNFGRYDLDLVLWKKGNHVGEDDGYGKIPDGILVPYALIDVDVPMRALPALEASLKEQDLWNYYRAIVNPFVADIFTHLTVHGLPVDRKLLTQTRAFMNWAYRRLLNSFMEELEEEAGKRLLENFTLTPGEPDDLVMLREEGATALAFRLEPREEEWTPKQKAVFEHFMEARDFNIRSHPKMTRWLFEVEGLTPVKTTKNVAKGIPSVPWEKLMEMKPAQQAAAKPAVDKETLELLSTGYPILESLLAVNNVGNLCKGFLKEGETAEDGTLVKENGIAKFLCDDDRIHGMWSLTETGRPRCVHEDTLVPCRDGVKRIADIEVGDEVWTHRGRWKRVTGTYVKPESEMFEVHFTNGEVLICTEEHLLLTREGQWVSLRHVCLQKAFGRSGNLRESRQPLSRIIDDLRASGETGGHHGAYDLPNFAVATGSRGISEIESSEVFKFQARNEESLVREAGGRRAELEGRLPGWLRLSDTPGGAETCFLASDRVCGNAGDSCGSTAGEACHSSHRREPNEQPQGQPRALHEGGASLHTQPLQEHGSGIEIAWIVPCGSHPVYDISVEEDASYEACGCFSHNSWKPNVLNLPSYLNRRALAGLTKILVEEGIPPEYEDLFGNEGDGDEERLKAFPSIRSTIAAPEGWCFVESDFKTAEIRAQAFQSGDTALIRLMTESDPAFALVETGVGTVPVRLFFPENSGIMERHCSPEFIMSRRQRDGKWHAVPFEDLLRDENGEILHPPCDLHWSLAEMNNGKPREMLSKEHDRIPAKIVRFCIAEDELVLTRDRGWIPIQNISDCDLLWDGSNWVRHEGVVRSGRKEVIYYQGLWATREHEVWTEEKEGKVPLGEARAQSLTLVRPCPPCGKNPYSGSCDFSRNGEKIRIGLFSCFNPVRKLWRSALEGIEEHGKRFFFQMPMPGIGTHRGQMAWSTGKSREDALLEVSSHGPALLQDDPCKRSELSSTRDKNALRVSRGIYDVGFGEMAGGDVRRKAIRSNRQRRALREGQPAAGHPEGELVEHAAFLQFHSCAGTTCHGPASGNEICLCDRMEFDAAGARGDRNPVAVEEIRFVETYDIVNAGPENRFTCSGVLVSNSSAYGAVASTLERRIAAQTGTAPLPGTGERLLEALAKQQPVTQAWLDDLAQVPARGESLRAASGRVRHFPVHPASLHGLSSRVRNAYLRPMANEARNFYPQEGVGATAAKAFNWLLEFCMEEGLRARPCVCLYDSIVTETPYEERFLVSRLHQLFMTDVNIWTYHGRWMNYPIDTDFNLHWSRRPQRNMAVNLADPTWNPADPEFEKRIMEKIVGVYLSAIEKNPDAYTRLNCV